MEDPAALGSDADPKKDNHILFHRYYRDIIAMAVHSHRFVEIYKGLVGFGLNRETDENTVKFFLQKFSDDNVLERITPRLTDDELDQLFGLISRLLRDYLSEDEYHRLFLKDDQNP